MFEVIIDQNKTVIEGVDSMQERMKLLATQESLDKLTQEVKTIKKAVIANRKDHDTLEKRVTRLERRVA